jgi:hypothetical protein
MIPTDIRTLKTQILNGKLQVADATSSSVYQIIGSELLSNITATLPTLIRDDTFLFQDSNQRVTNKDFTDSSNKFSPINLALLLGGFGTANQVLSTNSTADGFAWVNPYTPTPREDIGAHWSALMRNSVGTTFLNMKSPYMNNTATNMQEMTNDATYSIDFTNKTQFKVQFMIQRDLNVAQGTSTNQPTIQIVDNSNNANVLFSIGPLSSDGKQTISLTSIPSWATSQGVSTLLAQIKNDTASNKSTWITDMVIFLK